MELLLLAYSFNLLTVDNHCEIVLNNYLIIDIKVPNKMSEDVVIVKKIILRFVRFFSSIFTLFNNIFTSTIAFLSKLEI